MNALILFPADDFSAARAVASLKATIDALLTSCWVNGTQIPQYYTQPALPPNQRRAAVTPANFLAAVLPYSSASSDPNAPFQLIDPTCVVSGTFDDYPPLTQSAALSHISALNAATLSKNGDPAQYAQIGTLPLYVALEGKNRVMLYREHLQPIGARVKPVPYPAYVSITASDLILHAVLPFGQTALSRPAKASSSTDYDWLCGGRAYTVLPFPDVVIPLLLRYGVRIGRSVLRLSAGKHQQKRIGRATGGLMT